MAERSLVDYTLKNMRRLWRKPVKHADAYTAGVADVSAYMEPVGTVWIEMKALHRWPVRVKTLVKVGMDDLQRDFLLERKGWLFVRIGREYLLFDWNVAYWLVDTELATQQKLRAHAARIWKGQVDWNVFSKTISRRVTYKPLLLTETNNA